MTEWNWPNFTHDEFVCRHCGSDGLKTEAKDKIQELRTRLGRPLRINSAYRCPEHNAAVGGAINSRHKVGDAFDINTQGWTKEDRHELYVIAREIGFTGFGGYSSFIHVDLGIAREWGEKL